MNLPHTTAHSWSSHTPQLTSSPETRTTTAPTHALPKLELHCGIPELRGAQVLDLWLVERSDLPRARRAPRQPEPSKQEESPPHYWISLV